MSVVTDVEKWGNSHRPGFLDIFRIVLGIFITYKGLSFITNMDKLEGMTTSGVNIAYAGAALAHYIVFAHILGGPLIAVGLFTRIVSAIQLPILIGAVFFVNHQEGFLALGNHMELEVSITVLVGLVTFIIFGAGKYSIDEKRRREEEMHAHSHSHSHT
ncbi:MAG TPA: DoxX family protein [Cyclobacteriaceae bacterium]|nr:DoxX family protein [Cyclobacteriaceae bacterium]